MEFSIFSKNKEIILLISSKKQLKFLIDKKKVKAVNYEKYQKMLINFLIPWSNPKETLRFPS